MAGRILITGAGGFIGGFIVEEALRRGWETWAGVRKSTSRDYLTDERIRFVDLDFAHPKHLATQLYDLKAEGVYWDCIIHNLGVTKCLRMEDFERINTGFVCHFADALIATEMVPRQFILMSSLGAWGAGDETTYTPIRLTDEPRPETRYGKSKLGAEQYLCSLPGFPYVIMRPTGVYGPRERDYFLMIKSIASGIDFAAGFKPQQLTFIYVKDLVQAIFKAIDKGVKQRSYFVSEGRGYTAGEFRAYVARELGKRFVLPVRVPLFVLKLICLLVETGACLSGKASTLNRDKYRIMKQRNWICDIEPLRTELGFKPEYTLERGVKECVAWYKENGWL